ncbi:MAG: protoglobin domain-containing protein [Rhodospirillales bacterium]|nr:protoglobin domain-containing protein [Rhodospirillales bacterium]
MNQISSTETSKGALQGGTGTPNFKERLSFLRLDSDALKTLQEAWPVVERSLDSILEKFYDHVMSFPTSANIIGDPGRIGRLKDAQKGHWHSLFNAPLEPKFYEEARAIGHANHKIGLEQQWYMGAYAFVLDEIGRVVVAIRIAEHIDIGKKSHQIIT